MGNLVTGIGGMLEGGLENGANRSLSLSAGIRLHLIPTRDVDHGGLVLRPHWSYGAVSGGIGLRL
jgi:hypothetical protein